MQLNPCLCMPLATGVMAVATIRALLSFFVIIAILDFLAASMYPIFDPAFIVVTKVGSKVAIIFALIINIVDLLLSVLGWHFGGKKRNVLFCIIWVGFLALKFILSIADAFVADAPWDYVIRFADLGFIVYSIVVVGAFLMELVSQRQRQEEQEHPQQETVAGELQPLPSHGKNNTYQETPFTEFGEDDLHSLASHQKYYPY